MSSTPAPPRVRRPGFLDHLVPPAVETARRDEDTARLWGAQLPLGILLYVVAQTIGGMSGALLGILLGETTREAIARAGGSRITLFPIGLLIGSAVTAVVGLAGYWGLMRLIRRKTIRELSGPGRIRELGAGLGWGTALMVAVFAVLAVIGSYRITAVGWNKGILIGLAAGIIAGVGEELLFRGILLRLLEAWLGSWWALAVTAVLFGAVHLSNADATAFGAVAIALEGGILLGACYLVTRRLWFAIGLHAAWNFVQGGIFGSEISGAVRSRGLFEASFSGPDVLTGGGMGVEGSAVAVVICTAAGAAMAVIAHRRGLIVPPVWRRRREAQDAETSAATAGGPAERGPR